MADAAIKELWAYFKRPGDTMSSFSQEWKALTDKDKADLKSGIGNGTLNY